MDRAKNESENNLIKGENSLVMSKENDNKKNKEDVILAAVKVVKHETCKTYAFKRLGLANLLSIETDSPKIEELVFSGMFRQLKDPKRGALLLWVEKGEYVDNGGGEIDEQGRVIGVDKKIYGHLGVYEGAGLYSEVVSGHYFPEVRMCKYGDVKAPDYILEYITNE